MTVRQFGHKALPPHSRTAELKGTERPRHEAANDPVIADRRVKALDLKIAGASYRTIARQLDISLGQAYEDVQAELDALTEVRKQKAEHLVEQTLRRCDRWQLALAPAINQGDEKAIQAAARVEMLRARVTGILAPVKVTPTMADGSSPYQSSIDIRQLSDTTIRAILAETNEPYVAPEQPPEPVDGEFVEEVPDPAAGDARHQASSSDGQAADGGERAKS